MKRIIITAITALMLLIPALAFADDINGDFELFEEGQPPAGWFSSAYNNDGYTFTVTEDGFEGCCARLENSVPNDSRILREVECLPDRFYSVSAMVRTDGVQDGAGATITVQNPSDGEGNLSSSQAVYGTEWTKLEYFVSTGSESSFIIWLRLGGYSSDSTGMAYFDNVTVSEVEAIPEGADYIAFQSEEEKKNGSILPFIITAVVLVGVIVFYSFKVKRAPSDRRVRQSESEADADDDI